MSKKEKIETKVNINKIETSNKVSLNIFNDTLINIFALIAFFIFWYVILFSTKTIYSGYHHTDDQEYMRMFTDLKTKNYFQVCYQWIYSDITERFRFRPFYYVHRVLTVIVFKFNFSYYAIHNYFIAVLSSFFLFGFVRKMKVNVLLSLAFVFFCLMGPHTTIFWRLGTNETLGVFFISLCFYLLVLGLYTEKKTKASVFSIAAVISFLLSSLNKESFIILAPTVILIIFYCKIRESNYDLLKGLINSIKPSISYLVILIVEFSILVFGIGTDNAVEGTSGVGKGNDYFVLVTGILQAIKSNLLFTCSFVGFLALIISIIISSTNLNQKIKFSNYVYEGVIIFLIFSSIVFPQYLVYFKIGMVERYLIPASIGFAFLICFGVNAVWLNVSMNLYVKLSIIALFSVFSYLNFIKQTWRDVIIGAKSFTYEGRLVNSFLQVFEGIKKNPNAGVLIVTDPVESYEWSASTYFYLTTMYEAKNVNIRLIRYNPYSALEGRNKKLDEMYRKWLKPVIKDSLQFSDTSFTNKIEYIAFMPGAENNFYYYNAHWFNKNTMSLYNRFDNHYWTVFYKKIN